MKSKLVCCMFFLSMAVPGAVCAQSDKNKIAPVLKEIYRYTTENTDSVYLADQALTRYVFAYDELRPKVPNRDRVLLKSIIDSGHKEMIEPADVQQMLKPNSIQIVSKAEFDSVIMPAPHFTQQERQFRRKLDSLHLYINRANPDSAKFKALASKENQWMEDPLFRSSANKIERSKKRLIYIPPLLKFKNHILLVMIFYNTQDEASEKAAIIDLSK